MSTADFSPRIQYMFALLLVAALLSTVSEGLAKDARQTKEAKPSIFSVRKEATMPLTRKMFEDLPSGITYGELVRRVGKPTGDIGSGIHIMTYPLKEGGRALVGTPDLQQVMYIHYQTAAETKGIRKL